MKLPKTQEILPVEIVDSTSLSMQKGCLKRAVVFVQEHQRWLIVALLFFVAVVNNLDRQSLSVLAPTLRENLHFGAEEYSYIVTAFLIAYTVGYSFCGNILDRIGVKLGLAIALAFWSLTSMFHMAATGWLSLMFFRFLLGIGESFNSPAGIKAISEWIPQRERALCTAVFSNGNIFGAMLAPPLVSFLALNLGWRWAFLITGATGLFLLVIWWRFYDSPEQHKRIGESEKAYILANRIQPTSKVAKASVWSLLTQPLFLGFFLVRMLTDSLSFFFSFWLPDYLTHSRGFTLAMIGMVGWLPFLAADIGGPGGGAFSDWLVRRGWQSRKARLLMMLGAACIMPLANLAVRTESAGFSLGLIALLLAAQSCWMVNQITLISESIARENVATLLSLSAMGGSIGGVISTLLAGHTITAYGYVPVFTALSVTHLIAFSILLLCLRMQASRQSTNDQKMGIS